MEDEEKDVNVVEPPTQLGSCKSKSTLKKFMEQKRKELMAQTGDSELTVMVKDPYKKTNDLKGVKQGKTLYGYVPSEGHFNMWDPHYQEGPARSTQINKMVEILYPRLVLMGAERVNQIEDHTMLTLVHDHDAIQIIRDVCVESEEEVAQQFDSIYFNGEKTYNSAIEAARMTLSMAEMLLKDDYQNGFANIRPPGHHATVTTPNGYCFFNNVAIAAQYLLSRKLAAKILIVDIDVHHGQGTQEMFYETDKVLYFSIHRYEHGTFWPNLKESNFQFIGIGKGKGYNVNVPLNRTGLTDHDYLAIIINLLLPVAYEFEPSMILISAGYDACIGCPEGKMNVTPAFYAHLIHLLGAIAKGKILAALEGGYFLQSLGLAAMKTIQAFLNDTIPPVEYHKDIHSTVIDTINDVKVALKDYWQCFKETECYGKVENIADYDRFNQHVAVTKYYGTPETAPFPTRGGYVDQTPVDINMSNAKLKALKNTYNWKENVVGYVINQKSEMHDHDGKHKSHEIHKRLTYVVEKLKEFDILQRMHEVEFDCACVENGVNFSLPGNWKETDLAIKMTHGQDYLITLESATLPPSDDLYINANSMLVCHYSCAILCEVIRDVIVKNILHGVALIRPPGHHAKRDQGGGFCLVNNVVVGANYALREENVKRVLIVDFDIHHGDGTQELTYERNDIMYISVHRYENASYYPCDTAGNFTNVGSGAAAGYNVNIPLEGKIEDADYLHAWLKVVVPMSYAYNPSIILVSAGFDAGVNDPLGNAKVSPQLFGHLVQLLKAVAPVVLVLEGGYNLETTSLGMVNCCKVLLGDPIPMPNPGVPSKLTVQSVQNTISVLKPFWPIMAVNKRLDPFIRDQKELDEAIALAKPVPLSLNI